MQERERSLGLGLLLGLGCFFECLGVLIVTVVLNLAALALLGLLLLLVFFLGLLLLLLFFVLLRLLGNALLICLVLVGVVAGGGSFHFLGVVAVEETLLLELLEHFLHGLLVLAGLGAARDELQSLFDLVAQGLTNLSSGVLTEAVNTASNSALVRQIARDLAFVRSASSANERRVKQQTVLGSLALGLECAEQSLLSTKDLNGGGGVLGEVGETTGMSDEFGANNFANEGLKVRSDGAHALLEELGEGLAESHQLGDALGPLLDLEGVLVADVHAHRDLDGVDDLGSLFLIKDDLLDLFFEILSQIVASGVAEVDYAGVDSVVVDNLGELGEVPGEPLLQAHGEGVDVLVHLLNKGDRLSDRLVLSVHVRGATRARERVTETELGFSDFSIGKVLEQLGVVHADAANHLHRGVVVDRRDAGIAEELRAKFGVADAERELLLLG
mmetsp:Transcript_22030/g.27058  ORF Transcript_22030/g.27058 Transcript_22030/m.27058 type:complete len:444 (-) Transcript_22030:276-1607(-)